MSDTKPRKTDVQKLQRAIVDGLEDVKGQDIVVFNTELLSPLFERVIIASGTSNRQTKALASSVADAVREAGFPKPRIEGEDNGEWIIVDCGAAVAHVMQPTIRQYYHLEEIWGGKAVHLKSAAVKAAASKSATSKSAATAVPAEAKAPARARKTAKATDAADTVAVKAPAKSAGKPAAKVASKTVGKAATAVASKSAGKTPVKPVGKTAAKTATKATSAAKVKTVVVGKPAAKKAVATRAPARKKAA